MGPYCVYCQTRCFVALPENTPQDILEAYGRVNIIATCPGGQLLEKKEVGYCYSEIKIAIKFNY